MKLRRPARRAMPETIIALVDVVFFLLVFFMLVGRMDATAPFEVLPAQAVTGTPMPGGGVTVSIAADGTLAFEGAPTGEQSLIENLRAAIEEKPETLVRVNAHKSADLRNVLPLVAQITKTGAADVVLVVTPEEP